MKTVFALKLVIIVAITCIFTACADYLSDNNNETVNGKIGLPGGVNILNTNLSQAKSRGGNELTAPDIHTRTAVGGKNPFYLRYTTTPGIMTKNSNSAKTSTRGVAITTNSFYDSYSLYSYVYSEDTPWSSTVSTLGFTYTKTYFDEEVKLSKAWGTNEYWPGNRKKCAFFAYAPYHAKGLSKFNSDKWPSFHYSVPTEVTEQNDLLVTKNDISTGNGDYGNIDVPGNFNIPDSITFDHACTAIRFALGDQMAPGIIKKIRIGNVYGTGNYNYETENWSNVDTLKTFTLTQDFEIKEGEHNKLLNNYDNIFMMIPQTVPKDATIEITIDDGSVHTITAYIDKDEWKKGYTVTYYLSTAKVGSSYVLSIAPSSGNIAYTGGTKAVTINSYKQTYYGTLTPVPWTASYTYDDANEIGTTVYNASTAIVPAFTASGTGSTTGESTNFQVASQVARSKSWRSVHTQTLRNAADGSCNLAAGKETANCYVIQAPGTYTFPLVYGNALNSDGSINTNSYNSATFVDHNGIQINSPYIYSTNNNANIPYDACLVWQDAPQLVKPSSVQLTSDKHNIQFTIDRKNICQGNCVIAVRDQNQNIMWSWHIWVTDHSMSNTKSVINQDGIISKLMEVPLGWCDEDVRVYDPRTFHITVKQSETGGQTATANVLQLTADSTYSYGINAPFYQWGRKDPMLPSNGIGNVDKPYYDNQYTFTIVGDGVATNVAIMHPNIMYVSNSWSSNNSLEFWNKGNSVSTYNNNQVYKTIYSPSPTGFVEPKSAIFTGFTYSGANSGSVSGFNVSGSFNKGWNFYSQPNSSGTTILFYAFGWRSWNSGQVGLVNNRGNYWSSGPARDLYFDSGNVWPQYGDLRSYGFTSWSVLE